MSVLNSNDAECPQLHGDRSLASPDLSAGTCLTNHTGRAAPPVTVLNIDTRLYPAQQGSGFLLAIFPKVCFFPSLHSRVYPEWFNYNFPCVRQIKEESRSVVPSTLFISLTDCSSPNPRAAAAAAAHRSQQNASGQERGEGVFQMAWKYATQRRSLDVSLLLKQTKTLIPLPSSNKRSQKALPAPFRKNAQGCKPKTTWVGLDCHSVWQGSCVFRHCPMRTGGGGEQHTEIEGELGRT